MYIYIYIYVYYCVLPPRLRPPPSPAPRGRPATPRAARRSSCRGTRRCLRPRSAPARPGARRRSARRGTPAPETRPSTASPQGASRATPPGRRRQPPWRRSPSPPIWRELRGSQGMGVRKWQLAWSCFSFGSLHAQTLILIDVQNPLPWDPFSSPWSLDVVQGHAAGALLSTANIYTYTPII